MERNPLGTQAPVSVCIRLLFFAFASPPLAPHPWCCGGVSFRQPARRPSSLASSMHTSTTTRHTTNTHAHARTHTHTHTHTTSTPLPPPKPPDSHLHPTSIPPGPTAVQHRASVHWGSPFPSLHPPPSAAQRSGSYACHQPVVVYFTTYCLLCQ